ncbi:hypothetical protein LIA77_10176 [Sarocladium implicatum]|nr:hypothetical protein LIA77_10176 [Sarocladium implicatum]
MIFFMTPWPAYLVGTACIGRGVFAILTPRSEYGRIGLPLEASSQSASSSSPQSSSSSSAAGLVSPLIFFKGIREVSYGLTILLLQHQGEDKALNTFASVLALARFADGVVVWWRGGKDLRYKAVGHVLTGAMMVFWVWQRGRWEEVLPLMADLRKGGINPPFNF